MVPKGRPEIGRPSMGSRTLAPPKSDSRILGSAMHTAPTARAPAKCSRNISFSGRSSWCLHAHTNRVHGELAFKRRLADQTIRGNGFANGNSQGGLAEVLGRPLSPRVCRPIALDEREPRYSSF